MTYDLDNAVGYWLHLGFNRLRARSAQHLEQQPHGIAVEQWAILVRLWQQDGRSQTELAEATFRDKTAVTRMIDALEGKGLVAREPHPGDRRRHRIVLTPAGRDAEHQLSPIVREWVQHCFRGIDPADLAATVRVCKQLLENLP